MKNAMMLPCLLIFLFFQTSYPTAMYAQNPTGAGTEAAEGIKKILEKEKPDPDKKDDIVVKKREAIRELEKVLEKAKKDHPNDPDAVKDAVKDKLDELAKEDKYKVLKNFFDNLKNRILKSISGMVFTFVNNTGQDANDLHLVLSEPVKPTNKTKDPKTGVEKVGGVFERHPTKAVKEHDYKTGTSVVKKDSVVVIQMDGTTEVISWYWTFNGERIGDIRYGYSGIIIVSHQPDGDFDNPKGQTALIAIGLGIPAKPAGMLVSGEMTSQNLQAGIFSDVAVFEQIVEHLQGEFIIGLPTNHLMPDIQLEGSSLPMPGVSFGYNVTRNLELSLGANYFRSKWSGRFPITVFASQNTASRQEQGIINTSAEGMLTDVGLRYLLPGKVRPYIESGVRAQLVLDAQSGMEIGGTKLPFEAPLLKTGLSGYAGAGVRANIWNNLYAQAGVIFSKWPGSPYKPGGNVSLGFAFGRVGQGN